MGLLKSTRETISAIGELFRTLLLAWWAAFLLPGGVLAAIVLGGWLYFFPFLAANILIAYKLNRARKTGQAQMIEDKSFTKYEKSLGEYLELVKKSQEDKVAKTKTQEE